MKKIYVVLSFTGTILSTLIKFKTKSEYCHSSISLDKELKHMYSFGRLNPYNPFIGGFIQEYRNKGTFKRFKKTKVLILELEINEEKFLEVKKEINRIKRNKKEYTFNVTGLFLAGLNIKYTGEKTFYCAEFVKYILEKGDIYLDKEFKAIKPENFKKLINSKIIYKGKLINYLK